MSGPFRNADLYMLLPQAGHIGVPCSTCAAVIGEVCMWPAGTPRFVPHAAREQRAWHVRAWLFMLGIDANDALKATP